MPLLDFHYFLRPCLPFNVSMIQIEIKDLETGKEYNVAYFKNKHWIPCVVKVVKEYTISLVCPQHIEHSPLEYNKEYAIHEFYHEYRGTDLFGNKFRMLNCWNTSKECKEWCDKENKFRDKYVNC